MTAHLLHHFIFFTPTIGPEKKKEDAKLQVIVELKATRNWEKSYTWPSMELNSTLN